MEDGDLAQPCAVTFWTFATPVIVGNLAMFGVDALTKVYYAGEHPTTRKTVSSFASYSAFWIAAGLTWFALNRRNGEAT